VAVRARPFSRHDHLIGRDHGAHGAVARVRHRIIEDEIAPLGELGVDQPAGGIERATRLLVFPMRRRKILLRLRPQRGDLLGPARRDADLAELAVKLFKRSGLSEFFAGGKGHRVPRRLGFPQFILSRLLAPRTTSITHSASSGMRSLRQATWPSGRTNTNRRSYRAAICGSVIAVKVSGRCRFRAASTRGAASAPKPSNAKPRPNRSSVERPSASQA